MHKFHNSSINIFELFPFVNFLKESGQVTAFITCKNGILFCDFGDGVGVSKNNAVVLRKQILF